MKNKKQNIDLPKFASYPKSGQSIITDTIISAEYVLRNNKANTLITTKLEKIIKIEFEKIKI